MLLCDHPAAGDALRPPGAPPLQPADPAALDAPTAALWAALGAPRATWATEWPAGARAPVPWARVFVTTHAATSQFDQLAGPAAPHVHALGPVACLALDGSAFHGHHGRAWAAAPGNLHLSVAVPTDLPAAQAAPALSMLPAVAACDAIARVTGGAAHPAIKWVNDVIAGAGKLAGVLTTTRVMGSRIDLAVLGVGVNLAVAPDVPPTPFVPATTCLHACDGGAEVALGQLAWATLDALADRLAQLRRDGPAPIARAYRDRSLVLGRRVAVYDDRGTSGVDPARWPPPLAAGRVTAIGDDLSLTIERHRHPLHAGRLVLEGADSPLPHVSPPPRAR